ncbi:hypothetical protein L2E82_40140 [Cichorium intybus]|uniref:Uncharacterized protein n=1 Tax=Cichorium intybus TaxID=13427 RepID=A0ACB9AK65_CICIN|nr:hypothetical protein L2E82_40140 [Cichorium intybus]
MASRYLLHVRKYPIAKVKGFFLKAHQETYNRITQNQNQLSIRHCFNQTELDDDPEGSLNLICDQMINWSRIHVRICIK